MTPGWKVFKTSIAVGIRDKMNNNLHLEGITSYEPWTHDLPRQFSEHKDSQKGSQMLQASCRQWTYDICSHPISTVEPQVVHWKNPVATPMPWSLEAWRLLIREYTSYI